MTTGRKPVWHWVGAYRVDIYEWQNDKENEFHLSLSVRGNKKGSALEMLFWNSQTHDLCQEKSQVSQHFLLHKILNLSYNLWTYYKYYLHYWHLLITDFVFPFQPLNSLTFSFQKFTQKLYYSWLIHLKFFYKVTCCLCCIFLQKTFKFKDLPEYSLPLSSKCLFKLYKSFLICACTYSIITISFSDSFL